MARSGLMPLLAVSGLAIGLTALAVLQLLVLQPVLLAVATAAGVAAIGGVALAIGLRRPRIIATAEFALLLLYVLVLAGRSVSSLASASAPIVAGSLFLSAQLGWWAIELRTPAQEATPALWNRAGQIGASSLGAAALAELTWQASRIHPGRGIVLLAIGLGAAIGVVGLYLLSTPHPTVSPETPASDPGLESWPENASLRRHQVASRHWLLRALDGLIRPADSYAPWRSHQSLAMRTLVAIALLVIDAGFTLVAIGSNVQYKFVDGVGYDSYGAQANAAPGIALGLIGAAAIILGWLVLYLRSAVMPPRTSISSMPDDSPPINTLSDLEAIRVMCRRAQRSRRSDPEFERFLDSLGGRLANDSLVSSASDVPSPTPWPQVEFALEKLERLIDV